MKKAQGRGWSACFRLGTLTLLAIGAFALRAQTAENPSPQQAAQAQTPASNQVAAPPAGQPAKPAPVVSAKAQRRAAKLYLSAAKLFDANQFEEAMEVYQRVAALDPSNPDYALAIEVARSHAVTALIQSAAKDRIQGDAASARATLAHARELDPKNALVTQHLYELSDDQLAGQSAPPYERGATTIGEAAVLAPVEGIHSFHLHTDQRAAIQQVFRAYGLDATVDLSVRAVQIKLDMDNASFAQAMHTLSLVTNSFYVALDAHRAIVARDTKENRQQFVREEMETVYLPGLTTTELTDVGNLAKNVFDAPQSVVEQSTGTITLRAPQANLDAFNATIKGLVDGRNQVLLEVRLIQLGHTGERNTGVQLPQQMGVFNVYAEAQGILNANQSLVQQIIASGLASPTDYLAIIGILLASGQVTNPLLSSGFATFGGGNLSTFGLAPGTTTLNLSINSSDSRELDQLQLRLGDGEAGTLRMGTRYPIQTSSFSSLSPSGVNIPGLTGAGSSSALTALLSSQAAVPPVPQVEYQDLGMTLKATPKVMRSGDVALTIEMKIDALAGGSINGNPILDNRAYSGVVTLRQGEAVEVVSELTKQESRAISGVPGLSEVPGLNNLTGKDNTTDYSTLLVLMTPHVIRGTQAAGHSPMMRVEHGQQTH
jgi:tetratricopeptide (TPR) repeat protein